ncbi:mechanosensitive ion channel family protein [Hymenobacter sp. BT491]|uniref:mechanosensitive ion channel family protein n=1 Tax=Hymenobacter sp. BT491 TaxID=2766779 RepID=UPI001653EAC5|nr:mechanosensitive ion channel domain-containing protein [Hymenobacter sp. BT491]MBC6989645.1 mechanosensitive ion channel [Hymenobacter sp. BT491]
MVHDLQRVLSDYWEQFLYLAPKLLIALVVVSLTIFIANRISTVVGRRLQRQSHDALLAEFLTRLSKWVLLLAGVLLAMQVIGMSGVVTGLVAGAGLSAFIVGFALKDIAENFLAGVVLAFNRPFRIHDTVQIKDLLGHVEALNLRTTLIKTFDGKHIYLPNAMVLREPLVNFTRDGYIRQDFLVSLDYSPDPNPDRAIDLIINYVNSKKDVASTEEHVNYITLEKSTGTTADLRVYFWTFSEDYRRQVLELKSDLMKEIRSKLLEAGFAQPATVQ